MNDALYYFLTGTLDIFLWGGELVGEENLPKKGPAVFIANHLDATGPIACCCSMPMRLHPWSHGDMMDREKAATYLNMDFTERQLHLKPPLSTWLSRVLSHITVPMLYSLGCVAVHRGDYQRMQETLQESLRLLREGKFLLIFPEDPDLEKDEQTGMNPFQHTFARLGEFYYAETRKRLTFHPLAIHPKGIVQVGKPVFYNALNPVGEERQRVKNILETEIRNMYLDMGGIQREARLMSPERK